MGAHHAVIAAEMAADRVDMARASGDPEWLAAELWLAARAAERTGSE